MLRDLLRSAKSRVKVHRRRRRPPGRSWRCRDRCQGQGIEVLTYSAPARGTHLSAWSMPGGGPFRRAPLNREHLTTLPSNSKMVVVRESPTSPLRKSGLRQALGGSDTMLAASCRRWTPSPRFSEGNMRVTAAFSPTQVASSTSTRSLSISPSSFRAIRHPISPDQAHPVSLSPRSSASRELGRPTTLRAAAAGPT